MRLRNAQGSLWFNRIRADAELIPGSNQPALGACGVLSGLQDSAVLLWRLPHVPGGPVGPFHLQFPRIHNVCTGGFCLARKVWVRLAPASDL